MVLISCFLSAGAAAASDPVRIKCGDYTLNVPSANVECWQVDTNIPASDDASPEEVAGAQVANIAVVFSDYKNIAGDIAPQVTFYRTEDFAKTSFDLVDISMNLSDILNNINSGYTSLDEIFEEVPFMPYQASERLITGLPQKIDFENGSGIRTIAGFQDTVNSASGISNLYYSFQGISNDGNCYVSAVFPLRSLTLNGKSSSDIDWNSVTSDDFQPTLAELDYYAASIVIE